MLAADIGAAVEGSRELMGDRIAAALAPGVTDPTAATAEQRVPGDRCYARHIVRGRPAGRFTILALVWMPGQFSPPHAHQTWCAYTVCEGIADRDGICLRWPPRRRRPCSTADRHAGYACFGEAGLDQIHRLGNAGVRPAISLHVYGVEAAASGRTSTGWSTSS
jgi:predicted metal-dependent enzyme (double-stranded beta helix superfamily)